MNNFVSFYDKHGSVPVKQNIADKAKHFNRRGALYIQLGIVPSLVSGSDVLEFGPGSGDNAVYTSSLQPRTYKLVEGAEVGCKQLTEKSLRGDFSNNVEIEHSLIQNYQDSKRYDLVLAEGLLPGQDDPIDLLKTMAKFVKPGGALVVTTSSYISLLADTLRRVLLPFFKGGNEKQKMSRLCAFFDKHLEHLEFVSRHTEDWVVDCIIHPWGQNYEFSMFDAATALKGDFTFLGSNPSFNQNWQWYKEFVEIDNKFLEAFAGQYRQNELSFINKNETICTDDFSHIESVKILIGKLYSEHRNFLTKNDLSGWDNLKSILIELETLLKKYNLATSLAIKDYNNAVDSLVQGLRPEDVDFASFEKFWGRAQQYMSFVRNSS